MESEDKSGPAIRIRSRMTSTTSQIVRGRSTPKSLTAFAISEDLRGAFEVQVPIVVVDLLDIAVG